MILFEILISLFERAFLMYKDQSNEIKRKQFNLTLLNFNSERVRVPLSPAEEPRWHVKTCRLWTGYELETWRLMLI